MSVKFYKRCQPSIIFVIVVAICMIISSNDIKQISTSKPTNSTDLTQTELQTTTATATNSITNNHRRSFSDYFQDYRAIFDRLFSFTIFSTPNNAKQTCGSSYRSQTPRIVNGKPISVRRFPWMVSLQRSKSNWFGYKSYFHSCGGSLISASWLVTAAHCVMTNDDYDIRVVAGTDNLRHLAKSQSRQVTRVLVHPDFDRKVFDNDIALMKVDSPFELNANQGYVNTICLDRDIQIDSYDIATVCGFGAKAFHQDVQTHLLKTEIAIVDHKTCDESFDHSITDNMICAGGMVESKRDACTGDSGGPLMMEKGKRWILIGVVSFGNDCARKNFPGIYTRVPSYYDWIYENID